jgi:Na+/proline symporter
LDTLLPAATVAYICIIFALALFAKKKVQTEADFLAAGRKLSTFFSSATLFATWFGAGTLLTATDAMYADGFKITALEPYGAGGCLLLAGLFFAKPLWKMNILTIPDFFKVKFGKRAEFISAIVMIPGYFGWIAVQIYALAGIVHLSFGTPLWASMISIALLATALTWLGGMWAITLTDAAQMIVVAFAIVLLGYVVLDACGNGNWWAGWYELLQEKKFNGELANLKNNPKELFSYLNVFVIASLGNLPGQDLAQLICSARCEITAQRSCLIAGFFYVTLGSISILLGLAARKLLPMPVDHSVLPLLAKQLLTPGLSVLLLLAIISIVLSTIDSAILATSSIIAHNLLKYRALKQNYSMVSLCRWCTIFVGFSSLAIAFVGTNAYALLEQSYAISLVGLFAPFAMGLFGKHFCEEAALGSMIAGTSLWALGLFIGITHFLELIALLASFITYGAIRAMSFRLGYSQQDASCSEEQNFASSL